jgi:hypothetical protein
MAWYDFILDRTGAIGSLIKHQAARANRDKIVSRLLINMPPPKETKILLDDGSVIWFDCAEEVDHNFPTTVTEFPIEDGASVSDHMVNGNAVFSVTGVFSDARLRKPDPQGRATLPDQPTQAETYKALQKLRADRKSFSLLTPLDTYTNIVLKDLGMPRNKGDALSVKMEFVQIRRATSGTTTVTLIGGGGVKTGATAKNPVDKTKTAGVTNAGTKNPIKTTRSDTTPLANTVGSLPDAFGSMFKLFKQAESGQ